MMNKSQLLAISILGLVLISGCIHSDTAMQKADEYIQDAEELSGYSYNYSTNVSLNNNQTSINTSIAGDGVFDQDNRLYHINHTIHQSTRYLGASITLNANEQRYFVDSKEYLKSNLSYKSNKSGWRAIDRSTNSSEHWRERDIIQLQKTLINTSDEIHVTEHDESYVIEIQSNEIEFVEAIMRQVPGAEFFLLRSGNNSFGDIQVNDSSSKIWIESDTNNPLNQSSELNITVDSPSYPPINIHMETNVEFTEINPDINIELPPNAVNASRTD